MIKNFVFTLGLPGCGKSTYLNKNYNNVFNFENYYASFCDKDEAFTENGIVAWCKEVINNNDTDYIQISADDIKYFLDGYTDEHPEVVHEQSVRIAKQFVSYLGVADGFDFNVIMDGGAINRHYTQDIIEYIRAFNPTCKITCLFFDTPINVCIDRVSNRDRKIPIEAFYDKNLRIVECINRYLPLVDEFKRIDYYTNKHIFLDMDGTIACYSKGKLDSDGNTDFVNSKIFINARPVRNVIDFVRKNFDNNEVYIITACANSVAWEEKLKWLEKYFPEIPRENIYFVGNKDYKHVFLKHLAIGKKWKLNEITIIDDMHETLKKCTNIGINAVHPSNINALIDQTTTLG